MAYFETVGNATVIAHDEKPILATDPWIEGDSYFGSWALSVEIPKQQKEDILNAEYIWFSHGHPDHMNPNCVKKFTGQKILLSDHANQRIYSHFKKVGYDVQILPDFEWVQLSPKVKVMSIADYAQDSILLIDVNGVLAVNFNDAVERGWGRFVKKIIKQYEVSVMLKLFGFGDVDMINIHDEDGKLLMKPPPEMNNQAYWEGYFQDKVGFWANFYGTTYLVPFSCFHAYQREDSIWAQKYVTPMVEYTKLKNVACEVLPPFIHFDCETKLASNLDVKPAQIELKSPLDFGDDYSEQLDGEDVERIRQYFQGIEFLQGHLDYVNFVVGGKEHHIPIKQPKPCGRGITFECPRGSLMTSVKYKIFDDMLIGNFMKTTVHGNWGHFGAPNILYEHFSPLVARFHDNGMVTTKKQLKEYMQEYARRNPLDFFLHRLEFNNVQRLRSVINPNSPLFKPAVKSYFFLKKAIT